jgi:hypothetical protein
MSEEAQQPTGSTGHLPVLHPVPLAPIRPPWLPVCSITVVSQELLVHIVIISPVVFLDLGSVAVVDVAVFIFAVYVLFFF